MDKPEVGKEGDKAEAVLTAPGGSQPRTAAA